MNYKKLALEAEENFEFEKALEYFEKAEDELCVKDSSLVKYGELLFEFQNYKKAKEIFEKIVNTKPEKEYLLKLAQIYEEINEIQKALEIYKNLDIKEKIQELQDKTNLFSPSSNLIRKFIELFSGREDVFSIQFENGYRPIRRPLNYKDVKEHLKGEKTIGIYQLKKDNSIKFAAYDIDIKKSYLHGDNRYIYEENSKKVAKKLIAELEQENIYSYIEYTGNRGYHIWIFFDIPILSYKIKIIMEKILERIDLEEGIDVEIFPKQTELNGGLGNLIKIPLGIHRKTGKKCLFVDENFEIISNQTKFLFSIKENTKEQIERLFKDFTDENYEVYEETLTYKRSNNKIKKSNKIKKEIRKQIIKQTSSEFDTIINGCSILKQIINKIEKEAYISEEEENILIKSTINLKNGKREILNILKKTINFNLKRFEMIEKQSKEVPITCEEIRKIILNKNLSLDLKNCTCKFPGNYNTPYAIITDVEEIFIDKIDINDIAKKIVEKNSEKFEIEKEIKNLKKMIAKKMGEKKELRVEIGTIKRNGDDIEIIL
ncbi:CRISPR-associated primase-polymerase type A1 [Marinitoga sp. 1154]|uniref:CRISPR-associated primase-polymerase type A1 n=1 Tax=Marinitoga sp. 1154 TaxID=1643335 RepID=UPI0015868FDF|nr:CRISPR-associated primase-polymerase type A1 [Marinitoga sp. 1154]